MSVYARGRDYHKVMRSRLQTLSEKIAAQVEQLGHRVFTDSAPVLEAELAARNGQGWRGKHTLLLNREAGSMFFLGEIYVVIRVRFQFFRFWTRISNHHKRRANAMNNPDAT